MSLKLGSNQITPIQIKNFVNNQSNKNVIPNKSTQVVRPDRIIKPLDNVTDRVYVSTEITGITYNVSNYYKTCPLNYARLNGTMILDTSNFTSNLIFNFSNVILTPANTYGGLGYRISGGTTINGLTITGHTSYWGNVVDEFEIYKQGSTLKLSFGFDTQEYGVEFKLSNFTLELSDDETFTCDNYDGLDQVTIQPIPSDYVIPEGTLEIGAASQYAIANYSQLVVSSMANPSFTFYNINQYGNLNYKFDIHSGFTSISQTFSSAITLSLIGSTTIIPNENTQIAVNALTWTTGSIIVDAIPNSIGVYKKILEKTVNTNEANEFLSSQTSVPLLAFANCANLSGELNLGSVSTIGSSAFTSCSNITAVTALNLIQASSNVFSGCTKLQSVNMPNLTSVSYYMFFNCKLTSVSFPNLEYVGAQWLSISSTVSIIYLPKLKRNPYLSYCSYVQTFDLPELSSIDGYTFYQDYRATTFNLPKLDTMYYAYYAFAFCSALSYLELPELSLINNGYNIFHNCSQLHTLSFPKLQKISAASNIIVNCPNLMSIYLMSTSMVQLTRSDIITNQSVPFINSALTGSFGSFYVPSSLLTTYQNDSMWSWWSSRIVGI